MEASGGNQTPAGWYPNPEGEGLRWWDGSSWTEHMHPGTDAQAQAGAGQSATGAGAQVGAGGQAAAASQAGAGAVTGSSETAAAVTPTGPGQSSEPERGGPSNTEWALSALLPILPLLGLIWGVYLIREDDGRRQAGNLAVILSLLVILVVVLFLQL